MSKEIVTINKGYKVEEHTATVSALVAYNILSTKKQFKHTSAEYLIDSQQVVLRRHIAVCPCCNAHIPAYHHTIYESYVPKAMSAKKAKSWCYDLRPFFDTENDVYHLYEPKLTIKGVECPNCGQISNTSDATEKIVVEYNRGVIKVSCVLSNICEVINIDWAPSIQATELPLTETVTFNVKKGKSFFELRDGNGNLVTVRDVTNGLSIKHQRSKLICLINHNVHIKRKLLNCFERAWKSKIPFSVNELDANKMILLTSYVGYSNENFFYNIPNEKGEVLFETSFKPIRKRLHSSNNCIELMSNSEIPQSKSIKSVIYANLGLLFYIKEIEALWQIFGKDHNLLLSFLSSDTVYANLIAMYTYPGVLSFYADFARVKSPQELKNLLINMGDKAYSYGVCYASLSKRHKLNAQKNWTSMKSIFDETRYEYYIGRHFEQKFTILPNTEALKHLREQTVNGYKFVALKSHQDYIVAGQQLDNCLGSSTFRNPVIGVIKYGRYIAAIEVNIDEMIVHQAYLAENESLEANQDVFNAYKKWCKRNNIKDCVYQLQEVEYVF